MKRNQSMLVIMLVALVATALISVTVPLVQAAPNPNVTIAPLGPFTMDVGQTKLFTATPSGGEGPPYHYQWYVGAGAVGTDSSTYTYTASGSSASITCKVTDSASTPVTSVASNAVAITVTKIATTMTITYIPDTVHRPAENQVEATITLKTVTSGTLVLHQLIDVSYYVPGNGWSTPTPLNTEGTGSVIFTLPIQSEWPNGEYVVKATFAGDDTYASCEKNVGPIGSGDDFFVVPEYLIGGLAALGACFVAFALFKKRSSLPHFKQL